MVGNSETLIDNHKSDVLIMTDRLASLYYYMVKNIIEKIGEERAEELVKKVIYEYGIDCGQKTRNKVKALGKDATIENYHFGKDLPSVGWEKRMIEFDDKNSSGREISYCPFADAWKKLNFEKWGRLYCCIDQAKYEGYNGALKCYHDKNMLDGDDCCIVRIQKPDEK